MLGLGLKISNNWQIGSLGQTMAQAHYDRVVADGGVLPIGVAGLASVLNSIAAAYNVSTTAAFNAAVPVFLDPHYTGYKLGTGSGTTLGQAARTVYAINPSADVTQATFASQPLLLVKNSTDANYWQGVGVVDNYCTSPDSLISRIAGDIELIVNHSFASLTGSNYEAIGLNKYNAGNGYLLEYYQSNGKLLFTTSKGSATSSVTLASVGITIGSRCWIKVNRDSISGNIRFYYSIDATFEISSVNWTQLGTTISGTSGTINTTTTQLFLGVYRTGAGGEPLLGKTYRATVSNAIGGTPVVDFNPASYNAATSQTQWTSTTGEVWTINTGTATNGYKGVLVDRTKIQTDGIDDAVISSSITLTQPLTIYRSYKVFNITIGNGMYGFSSSLRGEQDAGATSSPRMNAGTALSQTATMSAAIEYVVTEQFNGASSKTRLNNVNEVSGNAGSNNITAVTMSLGSTVFSFGQLEINTFIISDNLDTTAQMLAMYNLVKSMSNL